MREIVAKALCILNKLFSIAVISYQALLPVKYKSQRVMKKIVGIIYKSDARFRMRVTFFISFLFHAVHITIAY